MPHSDDGRTFAIAITVLLLMDALVVGLICGALVSPATGLIVGVLAFAAPFGIGSFAVGTINLLSGWSALSRTYPPREPHEPARRGLAPSFAMRWRLLGYNNCVRWAADDTCLHIGFTPVLFLDRAFRGFSIPWAELDFDESLPGDRVRCETASGHTLWPPRSALEAESARRKAEQSATDQRS
jgi:hypothetical protein